MQICCLHYVALGDGKAATVEYHQQCSGGMNITINDPMQAYCRCLLRKLQLSSLGDSGSFYCYHLVYTKLLWNAKLVRGRKWIQMGILSLYLPLGHVNVPLWQLFGNGTILYSENINYSPRRPNFTSCTLPNPGWTPSNASTTDRSCLLQLRYHEEIKFLLRFGE